MVFNLMFCLLGSVHKFGKKLEYFDFVFQINSYAQGRSEAVKHRFFPNFQTAVYDDFHHRR